MPQQYHWRILDRWFLIHDRQTGIFPVLPPHTLLSQIMWQNVANNPFWHKINHLIIWRLSINIVHTLFEFTLNCCENTLKDPEQNYCFIEPPLLSFTFLSLSSPQHGHMKAHASLLGFLATDCSIWLTKGKTQAAGVCTRYHLGLVTQQWRQ